MYHLDLQLGKSTRKNKKHLLFNFLLSYLYIYPPDLQESNGGANT